MSNVLLPSFFLALLACLCVLTRGDTAPAVSAKQVYSEEFTEKLRRIFRNLYPYDSLLLDQLKKPGPLKEMTIDPSKVIPNLKETFLREKATLLPNILDRIDSGKWRGLLLEQIETYRNKDNSKDAQTQERHNKIQKLHSIKEYEGLDPWDTMTDCQKDYQDYSYNVIISFLNSVGIMEDIINNLDCEMVLQFVCEFLELDEVGCAFLPTRLVCNIVKGFARDWFLNVTFTTRSLELFDAMAKIPTGLAEGKLHWFGSYEYCEDTKVSYNYFPPFSFGRSIENRTYGGRYCRIDLKPLGQPENETLLTLAFGACVPDSCNPENLTYFLQNDPLLSILREAIGLDVDDMFCGHINLKLSEDRRTQFVVGLLATIVLLNVIGTIFDVSRRLFCPTCGVPQKAPKSSLDYKSVHVPLPGLAHVNKAFVQDGFGPQGYMPVHENDYRRHSLTKGDYEKISHVVKGGTNHDYDNLVFSSRPNAESEQRPGLLVRLILCFSGLRMMERIVSVRSGADDLGAVHGVKVLSFAWLILGSTYALGVALAEVWTTSNLVTVLPKYIERWSFQPILNFHFCADSFFVCSGLLVTYWFLKTVDKNGGVIKIYQLVYFVIHRYIRLIIPYMLFIGFYTSLYKYLSEGPFTPPEVGDANNCEKNWWINMLVMNDLYKRDELCNLPTWYIASVFKLSIWALIVLCFYIKSKVFGGLLIVGSIVGNIVAVGVVSNRIWDETILDWFFDMIVPPWCRCGTFMIGIILGIMVYNRRKQQEQKEMNKICLLIGWIVALALICAVNYSSYDQFKPDGDLWSKERTIAFECTSRLAMGTGVAWILYVCLTGNGGLVNRILSWKAFNMLSNLTYMGFVCHAVVLFRYAYSRRNLIQIYDYGMAYLYIGQLTAVFTYALVIGLAYQWPIYFLEEAIVPVFIRRPGAAVEEEAKTDPNANTGKDLELNKLDPVLAGVNGRISFSSHM